MVFESLQVTEGSLLVTPVWGPRPGFFYLSPKSCSRSCGSCLIPALGSWLGGRSIWSRPGPEVAPCRRPWQQPGHASLMRFPPERRRLCRLVSACISPHLEAGKHWGGQEGQKTRHPFGGQGAGKEHPEIWVSP